MRNEAPCPRGAGQGQRGYFWGYGVSKDLRKPTSMRVGTEDSNDTLPPDTKNPYRLLIYKGFFISGFSLLPHAFTSDVEVKDHRANLRQAVRAGKKNFGPAFKGANIIQLRHSTNETITSIVAR